MNENKLMTITTILNFIVFLTKLFAGITFSFSTLIADSIQSFIDFFTDIMSMIANKIGKRRANKTYPFGYGQVYYLANLLTGILLFLIGAFIIYQFFFFKTELKFNINLFIIISFVLVVKFIVVMLLHNYGIKNKNEFFIESFKESKTDLISTCVVLVILILTLCEKYLPSNINIDRLGCLAMAIYVFFTAFKMIASNVNGLLMNDEENAELKSQIVKEIEQFKEFELKQIKVIKMSTYYSIFLKMKLDDNLKMKDYLIKEKQLKKILKSKNRLIRFIDIEPV